VQKIQVPHQLHLEIENEFMQPKLTKEHPFKILKQGGPQKMPYLAILVIRLPVT